MFSTEGGDCMDKETKDMFNMILEEMARMEERINRRFDNRFTGIEARLDRMDQRMELMQHEINACKLEKGVIELLFQKNDEFEKRISRLEQKQGLPAF